MDILLDTGWTTGFTILTYNEKTVDKIIRNALESRPAAFHGGLKMDSKNLANNNEKQLFSSEERAYLKDVFSYYYKKTLPQEPEKRAALQKLNREILDRKNTITKDNVKTHGPGFHAFMEKAENNGYVNKSNYGLYATFYDIYNPKNKEMQAVMKEIVGDHHRKVPEKVSSLKEKSVYTAIIKSAENFDNKIKKADVKIANNDNNTMNQFVFYNTKIHSDAERGKALGLNFEPSKAEEKNPMAFVQQVKAPKIKAVKNNQLVKEAENVQNMDSTEELQKYVDDMENKMNKALKRYQRQMKAAKDDKELDNDVEALEKELEEEKKAEEVKEEEKKVEEPKIEDVDEVEQEIKPEEQVKPEEENKPEIEQEIKPEEQVNPEEEIKVEEPAKGAENPDLVAEISKENSSIKVENMTWRQFSKSMQDKGWPNAGTDPVLFSAFAISANEELNDLTIISELNQIEEFDYNSHVDKEREIVNNLYELIQVKKSIDDEAINDEKYAGIIASIE